MSGLSEIPVRVEGGASGQTAAVDPGGLGGGVVAILHEILARLEALQSTGASAAIDLHAMPMIPGDRERLMQALGDGEITADFHSAGISRIRETSVAGVWWVEHRDPDDQIVADLIEITTIPELLVSQPEDVRAGARRLRQSLTVQASDQGPGE